MAALAELIWNSLDADATRVSIRFDRNRLNGLQAIRVTDNGSGIPYESAPALFGSLGGSWKKLQKRSAGGRGLHGKSGKGRFIAFALGHRVEWRTKSKSGKENVDFTITGDRANLDGFELSDPTRSQAGGTGTEVYITNPVRDFSSLTAEDASDKFANFFALYLSEYPGITIEYDGRRVDPSVAQSHKETINLGQIPLQSGGVSAELTIIEWNNQQERALHLCDASGISLYQLPPAIKAPGFQFTAYLKSDAIRELDRDGLLIFDDSHPDVVALVDAAKGALRAHFRKRSSEHAAELVREWKETKVYPYEGEPEDAIETAERQVFDVIALNINSYLSDFNEGTDTTKRFTFSLVKEALKENPESLQKIFSDVLQLPKDRQDDLAGLLEKTSLTAIITAARIVADRLNFLRGLEMMLFDKKSKEQLLERDQLHKILAQETWIFGEEFNLTSNEDTLNEVLEKHRHLLGLPYDDESQVTLEGGGTGRIDLMLARAVPQPHPDEREYLVVELKRPKKKIDLDVITQLKRYANAVTNDERFRDNKTRWIFIAVSNEMTDDARSDANSPDRPRGVVGYTKNGSIWAKSWGQIIQDCKGRLNFFKESLQYEADRDSAKSYLTKAHEKYVPKVVLDEPAEAIESGSGSP
jgi:hypothetical protein